MKNILKTLLNTTHKNPFIASKDLTKVAPQSPRARVTGFAIASRAVDKCIAALAGTAGEYQFDCPLDKLLFNFKGITSEQFKQVAQSAKSYDEVGAWLEANGIHKSTAEIICWSDEMEKMSPMKNPERSENFIASCARLGLNPQMNSTFDMLEADDRASFRRKTQSNL